MRNAGSRRRGLPAAHSPAIHDGLQPERCTVHAGQVRSVLTVQTRGIIMVREVRPGRDRPASSNPYFKEGRAMTAVALSIPAMAVRG